MIQQYQQISPTAAVSGDKEEITQAILDSFNVEQSVKENRESLDKFGGIAKLVYCLGLNPHTGLTHAQALAQRQKFGENGFPESPMAGYFTLLLNALSDGTLLVLLAAATVSLVIGLIEHPDNGWIEGTAIYIAIFLVANISAGNDYTKELQFRALEATSQKDERTSCLREGLIERINPKELVVGDIIILQAGDLIPADCIIMDEHVVKANESSLTGEPDDLPKTAKKDCFLLSSSMMTEGEECRALVIGIGLKSQWGKIKANLVSEAVNTPLQDKLEEMTKQIGYLGMIAAIAVFIAMVINIWARNNGEHILDGFVEAFILAVTVIVVAIPEGLPLAVTISLAYSTKKMYADQCFIRVLAACETMGNATCICSDKTGTLTENRMTVVEGWFADKKVSQDEFGPAALSQPVKELIGEMVCLNRTAYCIYKDENGKVLERPNIIGNKTEGALILMARTWGFDYEEVKNRLFQEGKDRIFSFNSGKKRSTAVVHRKDGSVRVYCKGATEWVLKDCVSYLNQEGKVVPLTEAKRKELEAHILAMAEMALRTLLLAHRDFDSAAELPENWMENPPDNSNLVVDCIVGIIDPLRGDVKEAVATAQRAGVLVRMVTGDNVATARAIARQCGIYTEGGLCVEGPVFRKMSPKEVDAMLPKLQVMARSSPDDKYLMVTRLNGYAVPATKEEWELKHQDKTGVTWEADRDKILPGYREEWESTRPEGGHVVGVTGDGTNDAPALKAADVGLAMGITGTKVAQGASDIVILDDRFSSIVRAIMWGRSVYDNIRKFLQFQLNVNVVALTIVFIGAVAGVDPPLNAVQMLWVNLVMDTFGALALGTEVPTKKLLDRRPYRRSGSLVSNTMWRNILSQSVYQLTVCMVLLFHGAPWFGVPYGITCFKYTVKDAPQAWNVTGTMLGCNSFPQYCSDKSRECFLDTHTLPNNYQFSFNDLGGFEKKCFEEVCDVYDYRHNTIIFNAFIFAQVFNEFTSRKFTELNMFEGLQNGGHIFMGVIIYTVGMQIVLINFAGDFMKVSPLNLIEWLVTIAIGAFSLVYSVLARFIPIVEDPKEYFEHEDLPPALEAIMYPHGMHAKKHAAPAPPPYGASVEMVTQA